MFCLIMPVICVLDDLSDYLNEDCLELEGKLQPNHLKTRSFIYQFTLCNKPLPISILHC